MTQNNTIAPQDTGNRSAMKLFLIVFSAVLIAIILGALLVKFFIFRGNFKPTELNSREQVELNTKLEHLGYSIAPAVTDGNGINNGVLQPEPFQEGRTLKEFTLSEREVNYLIGRNTDLADKVAIDFSGDMASLKIVYPVEEGFPVIGGKTLRLNAGLTVSYANGRPSVVLKGVNVWGFSVPDSLLGNYSNVDLVDEFGGEGSGLWDLFSAGVEDVRITDGELFVRLAE